MSSEFNKTVRDFAKALQDVGSSKTSPYDTQATVTRIDGNIAWVHIPGGVDETPVQLTTNAKKGDVVQVRVSGGTAWITGNATSPPTDDTKANQAEKKAMVADENATNALTSADLARQFADEAKASASEAKETTDIIKHYAEEAEESVEQILDDALSAGQSAEEAKEFARQANASAGNAYNSATLAIRQLSIVEDIVGVLELVAKNGVYSLTEDTEIQTDKWYFTVAGTAVTPEGTENPHSLGWYELSNGVYSLTEDNSLLSGKTYYTIIASPVADPVVADIGTYYDLIGIDDTIQNYVSDHIAYAGGVLSLQNGETRVQLSTNASDGLVFYNNGQQVAQYGADAVIGNPNGFHIKITPDYEQTGMPRMSFYRDSQSDAIAYMSGDKLYITQSVVLQQMDVGRPITEVDPTTGEHGLGQWSWKVHEVDGANNLYLKWFG